MSFFILFIFRLVIDHALNVNFKFNSAPKYKTGPNKLKKSLNMSIDIIVSIEFKQQLLNLLGEMVSYRNNGRNHSKD